MRSSLIGLLIVIIGYPPILYSETAKPAQRPKIQMQETTAQLANVLPDATVSVNFMFKNVGTADLILVDSQPSCGCHSIRFAEITAAGTTGNISVSIHAPKIPGDFSEAIDFGTNDPTHKKIRATIIGTVKPLVNVDVGEVRFGVVQSGNAKDITVHLHSSQQEFAPVVITVTNPFLRSELNPDKIQGGFALTVKLQAGSPAGMLYARIHVRTGLRDQPEITIPVLATVTDRPTTTRRSSR